jgi:RNA polymerase sigma-70 factor (sigma-B/F/G subfamily)
MSCDQVEHVSDLAGDAELILVVQTLPHGDPGRDRACECLMERYGHIVRATVRHYRTPPDLTEDLIQVGYLGLMKAINNFDPSVGDSLGAYAQPCVSGEVKRYFRDKRWQVRVSRPVQELRLQLRQVTEELTHQLGRAPTDAELVGSLHVTPAELSDGLLSTQAFQAASLDAPVSTEDDSASMLELMGAEDPALDHALDMEALRVFWNELSEPDQQLLLLRFYGNMTQTQIAERLGTSQMQVSRLLRRVLGYLHSRFEHADPQSAA